MCRPTRLSVFSRPPSVQIRSASSTYILCPGRQRGLCSLPEEENSTALSAPPGSMLAHFHANGGLKLGKVFPNLFELQACICYSLGSSSQDTAGLGSQQVVRLNPEQEVKGHPLGPACLVLSPHQLWLASAGRDGLLRIRETSSMVVAYSCKCLFFKCLLSRHSLLHLQERYTELQCHPCRLGGVRSLTFSTDSLTLLTAGCEDGSLVCTNLRYSGTQSVPSRLHNPQLRTVEGTVAHSSHVTLLQFDIVHVRQCFSTHTAHTDCAGRKMNRTEVEVPGGS